ncbi:hypothetical protein HXX76_014807 [Chlamydomonas incerta]|uniref:BUD13 homolog n=1 Tax=Chlamydomonas incerta TaxID=51695 RepID=A0A835SBA6_CHLIN|nr:hypothetical protein HXX76_014807 [Chlamydomonas incerta]|eukprot:KAG2424133.1 hypothetical protein HXX76_014807 [Chlamydomonas incerta]
MSFAVRQTLETAKASKADNLFKGLSTLRADEKKNAEGAPKNAALTAYLAKNYGGDDGPGKKKKKRKAPDAGGAIRIVDHDRAGMPLPEAKARKAAAMRGPGASFGDEEEDEEEDAPTIANPEEAEALKKLAEKARSGSGWVSAGADGAGGSRRARHDSPDASPPRRGRRQDSPDASPPRRKARHDSPDASPPRRGSKRHDSPDASPPRRAQAQAAPDASPPRRGRQPSPDASPPRRRARHDSPDASPPRRGKPEAAADASPPRRGRQASPDASPPRRGRQPSPDASPPRRGKPAAAADASPPRRGRQASPDASPPRRGGRQPSPDVSPPRRKARHDSPDASPPRRGGQDRRGGSPPRRAGQRHDSPPGGSPPRRRQRHDSPDAAAERRPAGAAGAMGPPRPPQRPPPGPPTVMGDGTAAGLVNAAQLAADLAKQKAAAEDRRRTAEGRGAATVYRDKATGRIMTADEAADAKEAERAARKKPSIYDEDQSLEWRGGLAQKREAEARRKEAEELAAKPFARHDVDDRHDASLKGVVRFGDPFGALARKRAGAEAVAAAAALTERYDAEKLNKSGFKVPQEVPPHSWLKRGVAPPANRYNIRPGRHWDGVNRSNGFEADLFKYQNMRASKELEARLWSMGDM